MAEVRQIELDQTSRYKGTEVRKDSQGRVVFDPLKKTYLMKILVRAEGTPHTVTQSEVGRFDVLADNYYDDSRLGWVIMLANSVTDMVNDYPVGATLKIPDRGYVESYVRSN
jgi:hypothetical protein